MLNPSFFLNQEVDFHSSSIREIKQAEWEERENESEDKSVW